MALLSDKVSELQLMVEMTYEGDTVGVSLLEELVIDLIALAKGDPIEQTLLDIVRLSQSPDFIPRIRKFIADYQGSPQEVSSQEERPQVTQQNLLEGIPPEKIQELQLLVDMTHEGDSIGCVLIAEQLKELASLAGGRPGEGEIKRLIDSAGEPTYLNQVRRFLGVDQGGSGSPSLASSEQSSAADDGPGGLSREDGTSLSEPNTETEDVSSPIGDFEPLAIQVDESSPFVDLLPQDFLDQLLNGGVSSPASVSPEPQMEMSTEEVQQPEDREETSSEPTPEEEGPEVLEDLGDIAPHYAIEGDLDILQEFGTECEEHINAIEQVILEAEGQYAKDAIDTIFRGIHSIKGGSAYFNLQEMKKCSHLLEDMLHEVRDGHRPMDYRLEQLCLFYLDCQKDALKRYRDASASGALVKRSDDSLRLLQLIRAFDKGGPINRDAIGAKPVAPVSNLSENEELEDESESSEDDGDVSEREQAEPRQEQRTQPERATGQDALQASHRSAFPGKVREKKVAPPPAPADKGSKKLAKKIANEAAEASKKFVKVDTERLDNLIDLIGEMVVFSSVLVRFCKLHMSDHKDVMDAAHRVEKFSKELQDVGISMRLDPIRGLFQKMQRLVWDTSKRLGKDIVFQMEGEDTELDRNLIDRLADPLMHMVRNSLDHGIEPNDERDLAGKPRKGTIKLSAYHSGGNVHIKIQDDGRGLDPAKLIAKAIDKGIIEDGKRISNDEAFQLIFAPGFSTAAQVTDLSGRGVGMDVVRRNVEDLRGRIHIQSSVGNGAAFIIELPLTLAIIEGIQISVGAENFIIPSLSIVEFLRPRRGMISRAMDSAETFFFRGKYLPLFRLSEVYSIDGAIEDPERASIVVLEENGDQFAFLVDTIEGECSTVIKSLGEVFEEVKGVSGGAIMPQGNVVLILDVKSLVRLAQESYTHVDRSREYQSDGNGPVVLH
jgi:two-component system chemotaxis sensor kinase CheA